MAYRKMIAVCMTALTTSGCAAWNTLESQARADPRTVAAYPAHDVSRNVRQTTGSCAITRLRGDAYDVPINLDCFRFPEQKDTGQLAYKLAAGPAPGGQAARNRLASILIKHSDDICVKEMGDISARESISNTALGITTSLLSGLGTVVTGERTKAWLAGGAGLSNATRDHINAEVFRNVLASALAKAIENDRTVRRTAIVSQFTVAPELHSVDQMIADVNRYHQSCSFYNGLVLVVDAVNRASPSIAAEHRDKSAAIAQLKVDIAELDQTISRADAASRPALAKLKADLAAQLAKLQLERSNLSSAAAKADGKAQNP
jgi:hypothetical protein